MFVDRRLFVSEQIDPESDSEDEGEEIEGEQKIMMRTNRSKNNTINCLDGKREAALYTESNSQINDAKPGSLTS
jgi:hypothetical protein